MQQQPLLAAVDLGSNSFRLQVARVEGDQLYMLDGLREPVRLAAGLTTDKYLDAPAQHRALAALARFAERLRDLPREAVRAVGTNSLRVAKNAADFIPQVDRGSERLDAIRTYPRRGPFRARRAKRRHRKHRCG